SRIEIELAVHTIKIIKGAVHHADDVRRFIRDKGVALHVPEDWYGDAARIVIQRKSVDFIKPRLAIHEIGDRVLIDIIQRPSFLKHQRINDAEGNNVFKVFQLTEYERAVSPRAGKRHIEMIATSLSLEVAFAMRAGAAIFCHPVAED